MAPTRKTAKGGAGGRAPARQDEHDDDSAEDIPGPVGNSGRSSQPASHIRRISAPPAAARAAAADRATLPATARSQATGDGGVGCSQNTDDVECSQNTDVDCSQNTGGLDKSGIPVSRRASENAKALLASAVEPTLEFDKNGVGVIWTSLL